MKLKFTLHRAEGDVDLAATVDSATTVGELAGFLNAADPRGPAQTGDDVEVTLSLVGSQALTIDPRQPVVDSGLRSGSTVSISRAGTRFSDPGRPAAALVRIVEGPDVGKEFQIPSGSSTIGRDQDCEIRLNDSLVSRRHARLNITDVAEAVDMGSANGILIDDVEVPRSILRSTDVIQIGDTKLSIRLLSTGARSPERGGPAVEFVRPPRVTPTFNGLEFDAPEPPERARPQRFPIAMMVAPILMGAVLYFATGSAKSLVFIALSPIMMIGNNIEQRYGKRADYKRALEEFQEDVDSLVADLAASNAQEVTSRLTENPSVNECALAIRNGTGLLWTRRPGEPRFGQLRLGLGLRPSRTTIIYPNLKRGIRALFKEMQDRLSPYHSVNNVPIVADLSETALGVAGPRALAIGVARGLVLQTVALHSPAELALGVLASSHSAQDWEWVKWLPHTTTPHSPISAGLLAASRGTGSALLSELEDLIERRTAAAMHDLQSTPGVVLLVESDAPVDHSRLVAIAENGASVGVHTIWIGNEVADLPAACKVFIEIGREGTTGAAGFVHEGEIVLPLALELLDAGEANELGRTLAPVLDIGARVEDASDLPRAVSFLSLVGTDVATSPDAVVDRWTQSRSIIVGPKAPPSPPRHAGSLRALIGQSGTDALAVDLRVDGPHALVGGTTGAGKSELLQSWILGMATAHSPHRLTFLLVDYKGGSAFRDCVDLPHTVGLVTDLSPHLVRRALTSLAAELRYREHLLARHAAKDLASLERLGVAEAPPSLVIVVDEFAALVNDVPEFVEGVVNVAQRGRSLGLHLILATQRPAGVIKDNLRANTNLRMALRMSDETDSSDVLGTPDAAFFDPAIPGRAAVKSGPGRLAPFQTAYAGGWTSETPPAPELLVEELSVSSSTVWTPPEQTEASPIDPGPTDIRKVVDRIREACGLAQIEEPRKPWLPELRPTYDLADQVLVPSRRVDTELVYGVRDDPDNQSQPTVAFYPDRDGSMAVFGTGGSGKSGLLRTIAVAAGFTIRGGPCHVYGIDFGARGLAMLEDLPHVGSIIAGSDHERVTRLLRWIREMIDERAVRYSAPSVNAGSITDYRTITGATDEPRILLLIDGLVAFRSAYEPPDRSRWLEMFTSIVTDGRPVGVHVVVASETRNGLTTGLSSGIQSRVVLRMAAPEDYGMLGAPADVIGESAGPGRGVLGGSELQVAVLGGSIDVAAQAQALRGFADAMRRTGVVEPDPIRSLPEDISLEDLPAEIAGAPVLGIASNSLGPADYEPKGGFLISGSPMSGRTTAVRTMAESLRRFDPTLELHWFGGPRSPLAGLSLWTSCTVITEAPDAAAALSERLSDGAHAALFIENITDFASPPSDQPMQALVKLALANGCFVVGEGESSTLTNTMGLLGLIKASRAGLSLVPESSDGQGVYRTPFPRMSPSDRLPGRGLLVRGGRVEVVQVARPTSG